MELGVVGAGTERQIDQGLHAYIQDQRSGNEGNQQRQEHNSAGNEQEGSQYHQVTVSVNHKKKLAATKFSNQGGGTESEVPQLPDTGAGGEAGKVAGEAAAGLVKNEPKSESKDKTNNDYEEDKVADID